MLKFFLSDIGRIYPFRHKVLPVACRSIQAPIQTGNMLSPHNLERLRPMPLAPVPSSVKQIDTGSLRTIYVRPDGGPVSFQLSATNLLAVGARARFWRRSAEGLEAASNSFTLQTDASPVQADHDASELDGLDFAP